MNDTKNKNNNNENLLYVRGEGYFFVLSVVICQVSLFVEKTSFYFSLSPNYSSLNAFIYTQIK